MTAIYNAADNTLTEQSDYDPPPDRPNIRYYSSSQQEMYQRHLDAWHIVMQDYNANKERYEKTLRTIPCSLECRGLWKPGQVLVEGVDYRVVAAFLADGGGVEEYFAFPLPVKSEDGWLTTKPTFTEECILITASKVRDKWNYNFWLIEKLDDMEDNWYWGILCPDGDEWGDLADLEAEKYLVIPKLKP